MKNRIYNLLLPVCFLVVSMAGCKDDDGVASLPEAVPLTMTVNTQSLVMGDHLIVDFNVDGEGITANEDFDIYLSAKSGANDRSGVFKEFPKMITFKQGEKALQLDLQIKESGITSDVTFDFSAFVRGYKVTGATQSLIVSDYYRTVMSLKGNVDKVVKEGETFIIMAKVPKPVVEEVVVTITPKDGEADMYENLPASVTIPVGETTAESDPVTIKSDAIPTGDKNLALSFQTTSTQYPLMAEDMTILMKDADAPWGDQLQDERWVYADPETPFMSSKNKAAIEAWYKKEIKEIKIGDAHPNVSLATWKFYNAFEFHYIPKSIGWPATITPNEFGNCVPWAFGEQNTVTVQKTQAVIGKKYSTITEEGIMKMWCVKESVTAPSPGSGLRDYGTSAFYSSKFASDQSKNTAAAHTTRIYPGMRIEVRARIRGAKNGFNPAIWLQGNKQTDATDANWNVWPKYGEIDILENPGSSLTEMNRAFQTIHMGDVSIPGHKEDPTKKVTITDMESFNIYWVELVDDETVRLGINGETNLVLKKSDMEHPAEWPFDQAANPEGFHFLLTFAAPSPWAFGLADTAPIPSGWDSGFAGIDYTGSKTNPNTPRMEIDWVRFYTNSHYSIPTGKTDSYNSGNKFYFY